MISFVIISFFPQNKNTLYQLFWLIASGGETVLEGKPLTHQGQLETGSNLFRGHMRMPCPKLAPSPRKYITPYYGQDYTEDPQDSLNRFGSRMIGSSPGGGLEHLISFCKASSSITYCQQTPVHEQLVLKRDHE